MGGPRADDEGRRADADCGLTPAAVDELELVVLDELLDQGLGLGVGLGPEALEEGLLDVYGREGNVEEWGCE